MGKKPTPTDIKELANKIINFIKFEVGNNEDLIKIALNECEAQFELEKKLNYARSL